MFTKKCFEFDTQSCLANLKPRPHTYPDIFKNGNFSPFRYLKKIRHHTYSNRSKPAKTMDSYNG